MAEIEKEEPFDVKPYTYYEQVSMYKTHHFYLSEALGAPGEYIDMIHRIRTGAPSDIFHIHLNTPGGRLDTGVQLINAMQSTDCHIICSLEAEAHSLGTLIFLAADEFYVHDSCIMMFHNYSGGMWGKGNEQVAQLEATTKWFNELAERIYVPFLSEEELDRILKGEDIWLLTDDIRKRLTNMVKIMTKEAKEAEMLEQNAVKKKAAKRKAAPKKKKETKKDE